MAKSVSFIRASRFEWKVANVLSANRLESDEFMLRDSRWRLLLSPEGRWINVKLNKLNPEKAIGSYTVRFFVEDRAKKPLDIREQVLDDPDFATNEIWYISKNQLEKQSDTYLTDGSVTFVLVFTASKKDATDETVSDKSIQTSANMDTVACLETLSQDLQHLMDDGAQSDVTLKCDERSFPAHRGILSVRSEVFSAMFRSDMAESLTGVIEISDVDATVLDRFLHYVYSGKLSDMSVDTVPKLYAAADKYSVESLKKLCAKFMTENLTRENACRFFVLADTHGDKNLKECVQCFIANVELFRDKDIWFDFHSKHPKLASEVIHHAYEAKCLSKVT